MDKLICYKGSDAGVVFHLPAVEGCRYTIGRGGYAGFRIKSRAVPRNHAEFGYANGRWLITDLVTANGTYVNGKQISTCQIKHQDQICLGGDDWFLFVSAINDAQRVKRLTANTLIPELKPDKIRMGTYRFDLRRKDWFLEVSTAP